MEQQTSLLRTKLHRPRVAGDLVCRRRLHERMDAALECPLTLISAPAGYGKSMLASHWAETLEVPCAWVSLDQSDTDLVSFLGYFLAAVETVHPDACPETQALLRAPHPPPLTWVASSLVNELDRIDSSFVLILDDYHLVAPSSDVHELLRLLLEHPPKPLHLVLATRRDPPLPIASMRASRRMVELRLRDLQFTLAETAEFLSATAESALSDEAMDNLQRQTEGWAAGLCLVTQYLSHCDDPEQFSRSLTSSIQLTDQYLVQEVLGQRSPQMQEWLLRTSILDRFCPALCEAVCASATPEREDLDGRQFIEALLRVNLFTISLDSQGKWYRFHHLFQQSLHDELKRRFRPDEIAELHLRASEWLESEGLISESIQYALAAGDLDAVADLVERHRYQEVNLDRWFVVAKWLQSLPKEIKRARPGLLLTQAWIAFWRFELAKIQPLVEQAAVLLDEATAEPALLGELDFHRGSLAYWQGDCSAAVELLERALEKISGVGGIVEGNVEIMLGLARAMSGHPKAAIAALNDRIRRVGTEDLMLLTHLFATRVYIHISSGQLGAARVAANQLQSISQTTQTHNTAAWARYFLACADLHSLELDSAKEGFAASVQRPYVFEPRAAIDAFAGLAVAQQLSGTTEDAVRTVARLLSFARELKVPEFLILAQSCRARVAVLQDDVRSVAESVGSLGDDSGLPDLFTWLEVPAITHARVLIASGTDQSLTRAIKMLRSIYENSKAWQLNCHSIEVLALTALALEKRGHADEALEALEEAVELARPGGWVRPFVEAGPTMAIMLERLDEQKKSAGFVKRVLTAFAATGAPAPLPTPAEEPSATATAAAAPAPPPKALDELTDRELDVLELLAQRLQNKEIAAQLCISTHTVNYHLKHIYDKLGVRRRRQAVEQALDRGILDRRSRLWGRTTP